MSPSPAPASARSLWRFITAQLPGVPVFAALAVMILWAAHNGGFDEDTWYWGALVMLMLLVVSVAAGGLQAAARLPRALKLALIAFALYVGWSYLSIAWAATPGAALSGSNRALLYLSVFLLFSIAPWTVSRARNALLVYAIGIGAVGAVLLFRMAGGNHSASLFSAGRLLSPTGYINSNAALFTSAAFVAVALAVRKDLPAPLRGLLIAIACEGMQLATLAESRGWLFLLPVMLAAAIAVVPSRLRTACAAILPAVGALVVVRPMLRVFEAVIGADDTRIAVIKPAQHAARAGLLVCAVLFLVATVLALIDKRAAVPAPSPRRQRQLGIVAATLAVAASIAGGLVATHGHPLRFIQRQFKGTTQVPTTRISHFAVAGTERYDIWRVSLDALVAHPIGGLGQDNFIDYYYTHRHTIDEPRWTHSFELRLLAHTGLVGFALMALVLGGSLMAAIRTRRRTRPAVAAVAGVALLPSVVWLIHGSIDWFWEMPALAGPALAFLAMSAAIGSETPGASGERAGARRTHKRVPDALAVGTGMLALVAAVVVLAFPYLSVREVSTASDLRASDPSAALHDLTIAADLNPLNADAGRLAGTIALQNQMFTEAERRFRQAISRDPGGWFAWLGAGLAASSLGDTATARHDFRVAASINSRQPSVTEALRRVDTPSPLTPEQAFKLLLSVQ